MRNDSASRMAPGPLESSSPTSQVHSQGTKCPSPGGTSDGRDQRLQDLPLLRTMTPNPRNSMSITNTKGLLNMPGQNNCFLNSAVQVLWHLDIFRRSFRELTGHACMAESCIFCALKELFAQFQYSQESALPPDALRRALAKTFCDQRRFQLGFMDDAAECFENILLRIHFHIANKESEDMCSAGHCIPHQKFAMTLVEQTVCHECGATSEPLPFTQMVHYVPTSALCSQAKSLKNEKDESSGFGELLKRAGGFGDLRDCPSSCGTVIQIRKSLMNRPEIVSIGLVWDSERPTIDHIMDVFHIIGMTLKLQDVFHSVVDNRWAASATHQLVGIVTYYGKHYSTFFFHTKLRVWIYFDDAAVREIGPKWEQVVEKCCRGHFQPLLLLYADPHGTSVSTSTAPHGVTIVSGHKKSFSGKDIFGLFKVADKFHQAHHVLPLDNQRRAATPNPETSFDINADIQPRRAVTPSGEMSRSSDIKTDVSDKSKHTSEPVKQTHLVPSNSSISKVNLIQNLPFNMPNYFIYKHEFWPLKHTNTNAGNLNRASQLPDKLSNEIPHVVIAQNAQFLNNTLQKPSTQKNGTDVSSIVCVQGNTLTNDISQAFTLLNPPISNCSNIPFQGSPNNSSNSDYEDDPYINRRTVKNVLQLQKLQKQKSVGGKHNHMCLGPRNSNSSLDSLDNICLVQDRNINNFLGLKFDIPDSINIPRRRDSGNWSGDRNSASSSSTTSLDNPYFYAVGNKRSLNSRVINKASVSDSIASTDPGYDSFSLSSSDSYPSMLAFAPGKSDLRLGQILENQQSTFISSDLSQFQNSSQEGIKNHETHFYGFRDECEKLCIEADTFLAKSVERENIGDISMAALLSDSAAAKARAAMDVPYCNPKSLSLAKLKHSMCIVRSCNLHKKLKEAVAIAEQRKLEPLSKLHKNYIVGHDLKPGDFFSVGKLHALNKSANLTSKEQKTSCHTCREVAYENSGKTIEIYATLPKKSLKKKGGLISFMESLTNEDNCIEKSSRQKNTEETEENSLGHTPHQNINTLVNSHNPWKCNNFELNSTKSLGSKKKPCNFGKSQTRDSDLSDYSSEWEGTQKCSLHRTYSGPPLKGKGTPGESVEENQTYSGHPMKKQHRIRRKLMGGFMKRKNRSLPDLREGQDQLNSLSRSFDDSTMYQTPLQARKINDKSIKSVNCINDISIMFQKNKQLTSENMQNNSVLPLEISEQSKAGVMCTTKVISSRTHTPPPYKPLPPIAGTEFDTSFKKVFAHKKEVCKSHSIASVGFHSNTSYRNALPDDISNKHLHYTSNDKLNTQNCLAYSASLSNNAEHNLNSFRNNQKIPKGNIVWLKELQKKQEEIFQKKKLKEDLLKQHKQLKENSSMLCLGNTAYQRKCELKRDDILQLHLSLKHDRKNNTLHFSEDNLDNSNNETVINSLSENDQPNSVKYLASKFEKILKPVCGVTDSGDDFVTSSSADKSSGLPASEYVSVKSDVSMDLNDKLQSHESMRESDKDQENVDKDRFPILFNTVSLNTHNTHTTDRQFTNMLQIGTNVCTFKSTNLHVQNCKDTGLQKSNYEMPVQSETRRPDKPPDYETAIQRLELIRSDKNLMRQLENNHILNVESTMFEQDKRKRGSKKSVTFSDKVVLVACAGDEDSDFIPNPLLERVYKQHLLQNSSSDIGAKNVAECVQNTSDNSKIVLHNDILLSRTSKLLHPDTIQQPCNLCHHKTVSSPNIYCPDCAFYMSRFQS